MSSLIFNGIFIFVAGSANRVGVALSRAHRLAYSAQPKTCGWGPRKGRPPAHQHERRTYGIQFNNRVRC